jgi:hypothetical protein
MIVRQVHSQPEQPWTKSSSRIELFNSLEGPQKRFLHQIRRLLKVQNKSSHNLKHAAFIPQNKLSKCVMIAVSSRMDQAHFARGRSFAIFGRIRCVE